MTDPFTQHTFSLMLSIILLKSFFLDNCLPQTSVCVGIHVRRQVYHGQTNKKQRTKQVQDVWSLGDSGQLVFSFSVT